MPASAALKWLFTVSDSNTLNVCTYLHRYTEANVGYTG